MRSSRIHSPVAWRRRAAGWLWCGVWCGVLHELTAPWRALGGVMSERWRWGVGAALWAGTIVGFGVGHRVRRACRRGTGRTHAQLIRFTLLLPAAASASLLILGRLQDHWELGAVVATGFFAYWAGLDVGIAAWPMMHGLGYRFDGPLESIQRVERSEGLTGRAGSAPFSRSGWPPR